MKNLLLHNLVVLLSLLLGSLPQTVTFTWTTTNTNTNTNTNTIRSFRNYNNNNNNNNQFVWKLFATKKNTKKSNKKNKTTKSTGGGFGGASMEPCPCGSSLTYSSCCGKLHKDVNAYKSATAEQIVRARYSAYAQKQPEFLMASTHPLHKDFNTDLKQWKESIKLNMYDNFNMPRCIISNESYYDENDNENDENDENENTHNTNDDPTTATKANVTFIAELVLKETGEVTAFMETSTFERAKTHGGWLYLNGTIEEVPESLVEGLKAAADSSTSSDK